MFLDSESPTTYVDEYTLRLNPKKSAVSYDGLYGTNTVVRVLRPKYEYLVGDNNISTMRNKSIARQQEYEKRNGAVWISSKNNELAAKERVIARQHNAPTITDLQVLICERNDEIETNAETLTESLIESIKEEEQSFQEMMQFIHPTEREGRVIPLLRKSNRSTSRKRPRDAQHNEPIYDYCDISEEFGEELDSYGDYQGDPVRDAQIKAIDEVRDEQSTTNPSTIREAQSEYKSDGYLSSVMNLHDPPTVVNLEESPSGPLIAQMKKHLYVQEI